MIGVDERWPVLTKSRELISVSRELLQQISGRISEARAAGGCDLSRLEDFRPDCEKVLADGRLGQDC